MSRGCSRPVSSSTRSGACGSIRCVPAIVKHRYVEFEYRDGHAQDSQRRVRPFAVFFWGGTWTLGAWCELRRDFRNFRLDRLSHAAGLRAGISG